MYARRIGCKRLLLSRIRVQLFGGLIFAIALPAIAWALLKHSSVALPEMPTTLVPALIAHAAGFYSWRRMGHLPRMAEANTILVAFVLSYCAVFVVALLVGLDFSRFLAGASLGISVLWYLCLSMILRRCERLRLAVVPVGDVQCLWRIKDVDWHRISECEKVPGDTNGVVADLHADMPETWERFIADCVLSGIPVYRLGHVEESLTGRVEIDHLSENTLGQLNPDRAYLTAKEFLGWVLALAALCAFVPVGLLVAATIKLDSPGPALFRQIRVGYRGVPFTVYKFRTMTMSPEAGDALGPGAAVTRAGDERVTRVGRLLRRTRVDEVPQLFNILRGEMSWIGPRPEALILSLWYERELPFYRYRHIVKPGISGWAQVNQGHVAEVDDVLEKLQYDFYYIKHLSPWLDLLIVSRTVSTVFTGFGARYLAYRPSDGIDCQKDLPHRHSGVVLT